MVVIGHNLIYDLTWLKVLKDFSLEDHTYFDTLIALHILDENYPDKSLRHQYLKLTGETYEKAGAQAGAQSEHGQMRVDLLHLKTELQLDARRDTQACYKLYEHVVPLLKSEGLESVARFDNEVLKVLVSITARGWKVDADAHESEGQALLRECAALESRLPFNPRSPKQTAQALGLGSGTTDEASLRRLGERPWVADVLRLRELSKLYGTYYKGLKKYVYADGKVHSWYHLAPSVLGSSTVTGRLSSSHPNMQNQPLSVRHLFIPTPPCTEILVADAGQLELRILGEVTGDPVICGYLIAGRDLHEETGRYIVELKEEPYGEGDRDTGKTGNFAWFYGAEWWKLAQVCGVNPRTRRGYTVGNELYNFLAKKFPGVSAWITSTKDALRERGYVSNLFGRRRRLGICSNFRTAEGGRLLRQALNAPIQGGGGDLVKIISYDIWRKCLTSHLESGIVNLVHDEVDMEVVPDERGEVMRIVRESFLHPPVEEFFGFTFKIPLTVDIGVGRNWKEAKP